MGRVRIHLDAVGITETYNITCIFNNRKLHSEAQTEEEAVKLGEEVIKVAEKIING